MKKDFKSIAFLAVFTMIAGCAFYCMDFYDSAVFTLLAGLTMLAIYHAGLYNRGIIEDIYHAGLYNRGIIEDTTIASQKEIIERDKNTIDFMHGYIGFLEDYIKELKERNLEMKSSKTRK